MGKYDNWLINGINPAWIISVDKNLPKITLHCASKPGKEFEDAQDEIEMFDKLAANKITNDELDNGGTDLQFSRDGQLITITDGTNSWQGALHYSKSTIDSMSSSYIKWDMEIEIQMPSFDQSAAYMIYQPDFRLYSNIDYECWTGDTPDVAPDPNIVGGTVKVIPGSVTQDESTASIWNNLTNILALNQLASAYNNNSDSLFKTTKLTMSDFGVNIPTTMEVTRVQLKGKYGNNTPANGLNNIAQTFTGLPTTVEQENVETSEIAWTNINNIKLADGSFASAHNSGSNTFQTMILWGENFNIPSLPSNAKITRLQIEVKVANNSTSFITRNRELFLWWINPSRYPGYIDYLEAPTPITCDNTNPEIIKFDSQDGSIYYLPSISDINDHIFRVGYWDHVHQGATAWIDYIKATITFTLPPFPDLFNIGVNGTNFTSEYVHGTDPTNLQDLNLDSLDGSIPSISDDVSVYNNSNFEVDFSSSLGPYNSIWIEDMTLLVTFQPIFPPNIVNPDPDAMGSEIGSMIITENKNVAEVQVTGNACNLPATLTVNDETQSWKFSHDHNTGDTGKDGLQTLNFTISPPASTITLLSSKHLPPVSDGSDTAEDNSGTRIKQIKVIYA